MTNVERAAEDRRTDDQQLDNRRAGSRPAEGIRRGVPAWWLRVVLGLAGGGAVAVLIPLGTPVIGAGLLGVLVVASVLAPGSEAPSAVIITAAVLTAALGADPFGPIVLGMVPLVHLLHVSSALAAIVPVTARVHPAALRGAFVRFAGVQLAVTGLVVVALVVPPVTLPAWLELAALLGVAAMAGLTAWLLRGV